jgi:NADH-quinone oxidoreductase subunit C
MDASEILTALGTVVPADDLRVGAATDQPTIYIPRASLVEACRFLRDNPDLQFALLSDITAIDWWPLEPRFEIVYHLASLEHKQRLRLKVRVNGSDAEAFVPTVQSVWAAANWQEREVWDLFGVVFDGHPDLRRLLMPDDWEGHPLRKDYPVQIKLAAQSQEALQVTEAEFKARLEADRRVRTPATDTER